MIEAAETAMVGVRALEIQLAQVSIAAMREAGLSDAAIRTITHPEPGADRALELQVFADTGRVISAARVRADIKRLLSH